jgi:hypothetical protein
MCPLYPVIDFIAILNIYSRYDLALVRLIVLFLLIRHHVSDFTELLPDDNLLVPPLVSIDGLLVLKRMNIFLNVAWKILSLGIFREVLLFGIYYLNSWFLECLSFDLISRWCWLCGLKKNWCFMRVRQNTSVATTTSEKYSTSHV